MSTKKAKLKKTLYKVRADGSLQVWCMQVDLEEGAYRTVSGKVGGKQQTGAWTYAKAKNVGRANETTARQQAVAEARSKIQKQRDKGYGDDADAARQQDMRFKPMLAHHYEAGQDIEWPVLVQPKLDGMRCNRVNRKLQTRNGKPIRTVPHIEHMTCKLARALPDGAVLDGELYNHALADDFDTLMSLLRKETVTDEEAEDVARLVQYHIYDVFVPSQPDMPFCERNTLLEKAFAAQEVSPACVRVPTYEAEDEGRLTGLYNSMLEEQYEGVMLRIPSSVYTQRKCKVLLKYKPELDEEFVIVEALEGDGKDAGTAAKLVCELEDGRTFRANTTGSLAFRKDMLKRKDELKGLVATIKFQNYTPQGVPRFPRVKDIDRWRFE